MPAASNAMEIYRHLEKSNCRLCGEKTCLAFAGAVFTGRKNINACPRLSSAIYQQFAEDQPAVPPAAQSGDEYIHELRQQLGSVDLAAAAGRLGGEFHDGRLSLKILGKDFSVDQQGSIYTILHVNPWLVVPVFTYILHGQGIEPDGEWIGFREVRDGKERYPLFKRRCEEAMQRVADFYTDLFADIVQLFNGQQVKEQFASDISVVLLPLPKVPVMICYWRPDEGMASSLHIYFDRTVDDNLGIDALYTLCAGINTMFEKLAERHGYVPQDRQ